MTRLILVLSIIFMFLLTPSRVLAAFSMNTSSISPNAVDTKEQEVTVNITISDLPSESYFRVAWQESSGSQYFGYVKNNDGAWVKIESSLDCKNYYKVSDLATTSLTLITKIGADNTINNNGTYLLKARRYTSGCTETDSEPVSIQVNVPTPTPVPTNAPAPTDAPNPTETPVPTKTPAPTKTPTPTKKPTLTTTKASPTKNLAQKRAGKDDLFLAGETQIAIDSPTPEANAQVLGENTSKQPFIFLGLGVIILLVSGIFAYIQLGDKIFIWKKKSS